VSTVAHYQRRLSVLLREGRSPAEIRAALRDDPELSSLCEYIDSLQDAPLEVAAALAAKWGAGP
jgi:hypothetical protein